MLKKERTVFCASLLCLDSEIDKYFSMTICVYNDCISKNGYGYRWT